MALEGANKFVPHLLTKDVPAILSGTVSNVKAVRDMLVQAVDPKVLQYQDMDFWLPRSDAGANCYFEKRGITVVGTALPKKKV